MAGRRHVPIAHAQEEGLMAGRRSRAARKPQDETTPTESRPALTRSEPVDLSERLQHATTSELTLADMKPDPRNARKHNARNIGVIADSLQQLGAARSIVIDEDNVVLAGNGVVDAASEVGMDRVIVVETSGNEIVAVRRRGLTVEQKVDLALRDNRAGELSEWDGPVLKALAENMDLSHLFSENELESAIATKDDDDAMERAPEMALRPSERYNYVVLLFKDEFGWDRAKDVLGLDDVSVQHGHVTKVGIGRVIPGDPVIEKLAR